MPRYFDTTRVLSCGCIYTYYEQDRDTFLSTEITHGTDIEYCDAHKETQKIRKVQESIRENG